MRGAWGTRIGTSGRHALMRTGGIAKRVARQHPYAVGGTAAGLVGMNMYRHSRNRSLNAGYNQYRSSSNYPYG